MAKYKCTVCGYIHEGELTEDFKCPLCKQPASKFVFRMNNSCGVSCALFEADGGEWKLEAMENIQRYLEASLAECEHTKFIILR